MITQVKLQFGSEERDNLIRVIESGWITEGPECKAFHGELLHLTGSPYGVFAPNGTLALALGLMALGIGPGDEVIIPDTTFIASANAVILAGGIPTFCDVGTDFQIDMIAAGKVLTKAAKAIMPVHLYGTTPDMDEVIAFAHLHNLLVIEDACQGIGVTYKGQHTGTFGDVGCFSFYADKTITTGEGGFVVCKSEEIYTRLLMLRNQGRLHSGTFIHPTVGYNLRITDMHAAIGRAQLAKLDSIIAGKRQVYQWYLEELEGVQDVCPVLPESAVPFRAVFLCDMAKSLRDHLKAHGVEPRTFFYPLHAQPCLEQYRRQNISYTNAWLGWSNGVCLPVYPSLTREEVGYICDQIKGFYG